MEYEILEEVGSTIDYAKELAKNGSPHGYMVIAKRQTNGRGQYGRFWDSSGDGLYMSVIIYPGKMTVSIDKITLFVGEKVKKYLDDLTGLDFTIKLPNDIYYNGKKICGILTEMVTRGDSCYGVVGVGLNVNNTYFSEPVSDIATSLAILTEKNYDIVTIGKDIAYAISG